jgi:hypothetical protein
MSKEILTPIEFAERLKIGRSKLFEWMRDGVLVPGKHFVKIDRIVRFYWSDDILFTLEKPKEKTMALNVSSSKQPKLNWDY